MKKSFLILLGIALTAASVFAASFTILDDDRAINYEQLPLKARNFIKEHFSTEQPALTIQDRELTHTEYTVTMASGMKIEFDGNGEWTDVDCRNASVPKAIVPKAIADYVKKHHPNGEIVEIQRDRNDWEVKLNGGLELTFDHSYRLMDIDD